MGNKRVSRWLINIRGLVELPSFLNERANPVALLSIFKNGDSLRPFEQSRSLRMQSAPHTDVDEVI